jgi:CDP-glucose 4,6-dehydratase
LAPEEQDNLFESASVAQDVEHHICDIREPEALSRLVAGAQPDIVIHLAAQSLVRRSYRLPVDTYLTNVVGTLNLLEAIRNVDSVRSCVVVTTDKCYENMERSQPYQEHEPLGGFDPYSSSKACTEILTASYRRSFFSPGESGQPKTAIATARAGNVIGGGDWAEDRLMPDVMSAFSAGKVIRIRNPDAVRPWQYVLEPLYGYLLLAEKLFNDGAAFAEAWNFGPDDSSHLPVSALLERLVDLWGGDAKWESSQDIQPHEARLLALDSSKARQRLDWQPRTDLDETLRATVSWYKAAAEGKDTRRLCLDQIDAFERAARQ